MVEDIFLLLAPVVMVRLLLAGGSILKTPSDDCVVLANDPYNTKPLTAVNDELVAVLNPLDSLSELIAASVDSVELDRLLY